LILLALAQVIADRVRGKGSSSDKKKTKKKGKKD
jgi:hypothetical protein